jgi:hypothetical protein
LYFPSELLCVFTLLHFLRARFQKQILSGKSKSGWLLKTTCAQPARSDAPKIIERKCYALSIHETELLNSAFWACAVSGCKFERYHNSNLSAAAFIFIDFHGARFFSAWMRYFILTMSLSSI